MADEIQDHPGCDVSAGSSWLVNNGAVGKTVVGLRDSDDLQLSSRRQLSVRKLTTHTSQTPTRRR